MGWKYNKEHKIKCSNGEEVKGYSNYLQTKHWKKMRKKVAEYYNYTCVRCNGVFKERYHIHHNNYKRLGNEKMSDVSFYCNRCHAIIHKNRKNKKEFNSQYYNLLSSKLCKFNKEQLEKVMKYIDELYENEIKKSMNEKR